MVRVCTCSKMCGVLCSVYPIDWCLTKRFPTTCLAGDSAKPVTMCCPLRYWTPQFGLNDIIDRDIHEGLQVVEPERGAVVLCAGLILERT